MAMHTVSEWQKVVCIRIHILSKPSVFEAGHWQAVEFRAAVDSGDAQKVEEMLGEGLHANHKMTESIVHAKAMRRIGPPTDLKLFNHLPVLHLFLLLEFAWLKSYLSVSLSHLKLLSWSPEHRFFGDPSLAEHWQGSQEGDHLANEGMVAHLDSET
eukprot:5843595-Amphidinium_carterae.1